MRTLLNLLWAIFGGLVIWLEYLFVGLLLCITVVGIPFGLQCFKIAKLGLFPFGKDIRYGPRFGAGVGGALGNIIWIVCAGLWICLTHVGIAVAQACTIIGIPFALQHLKLALLSLAPFGAEVEPV